MAEIAPDAVSAIDSAAVAVGETWVLPGWAIELEDDLVTVARAAELVGLSRSRIYQAACAEHLLIRHGRGVRIRLDDAREIAAAGRAWRAGRADRKGEENP